MNKAGRDTPEAGPESALECRHDWFEKITLILADGGYAGTLVAWLRQHLQVALEIVKHRDAPTGFVVFVVCRRPAAWACVAVQHCCTAAKKALWDHPGGPLSWVRPEVLETPTF
ncbi:hypothetical protein [Nonomuraea sp. B19D2]|uniref:hypothetical protein n=1 Tax=Nonomuraea sp. B19D2 TaxID=3159561 RepID=UPI0032DA8E93